MSGSPGSGKLDVWKPREAGCLEAWKPGEAGCLEARKPGKLDVWKPGEAGCLEASFRGAARISVFETDHIVFRQFGFLPKSIEGLNAYKVQQPRSSIVLRHSTPPETAAHSCNSITLLQIVKLPFRDADFIVVHVRSARIRWNSLGF